MYPELSTGSFGDNLIFSPHTPYDAKEVVSEIKKMVAVNKASYKDVGGGEYSLDTKLGGAQILNESDSRVRKYTVSAWDDSYNPIGDRREFSSLSEAKEYGRVVIIDAYGKKHKRVK